VRVLREAWPIIALALVGALAGMLVGRYWFDPERGPAPAAPDGVSVLEAGQRRPGLRLPDLAGVERSLDEFDGAPLLINYWATWCPPCIRELPLLTDLHARRDSDGITVLAIALEHDVATVTGFLEQHPVELPIWIEQPARKDSSVALGNLRSVLPYSVLLDAEGRLLRRKAGAMSERDLAEWSRVARQ
jgi:thiol-disulfide isomerase/thioredoxin